MSGGYFQIARVRGVPIRLHGSALVSPFVLAGFGFGPVWVAGFFAVLAVHELGHALVARSVGLEVHEVAIHALGGHCRHAPGRPIDEQAIAWGGILAQGWLQLALTIVELIAFIPDELRLAASAIQSLNAPIALLNLIPMAPLDGRLAWQLPKTLFGGTAEPMPIFTPTKETDPAPPRDPHFDQAQELVKQALDEAKSRRSSNL